MSVLGLQLSVHSTTDALLLKTDVPQRRRACESTSAVSTSFHGRRLSRGAKLIHHEQRRPYSQRKVFAIAEPRTQNVGDNSTTVESTGHGGKIAAPENPSEPQERSVTEKDKFNWNTQWYPVAVAHDLDKDAPHGVTIIGRPLAIWWDRSAGKWQVYADQCPHRLAPLSEGSISEEGELRCSYHGWTFKGNSGECTRIPQAPPGSKLHAAKRACVTVYPSMEQQGIIWFWPDLSQGTVNIEAAANPPPIFPELSDPSYRFDLSLRDLDYGYETLIENLMDPSHVDFAHHKIQGNRAAAKPLLFKVTSEIKPSGYEGAGDCRAALFHAPCSFTMKFDLPPKSNHVPGERSTNFFARLMFMLLTALRLKKTEPTEENKRTVGLIFLCIPVSPGRSRLIWSFPRNFATVLLEFVPKWVLHMTNNLVTDSDMYLLHLLERRLEYEGADKWFQRCYAPATADAYVHGFRRWLKDFAGGAPDWAGRFENRLPPSPPRQVLLDRYYNHVVKCKGCRRALKNFRVLEVGFQALAIALVGLVATSAVVPIPSVQSRSVPLVCAAVAATLLSRWLAHFIYTTFYFHDYNHAAVK